MILQGVALLKTQAGRWLTNSLSGLQGLIFYGPFRSHTQFLFSDEDA